VRIDPKKRFAGVALGRLREALQSLQGREWTMEDLRAALHTDDATCARVADKLAADGLIEVAHQWPHGETVWHNTFRGGALANASLGGRVPREEAKRHVEGLLRRVKAANASGHFLYRVQRLRLFGSLLRPDRALVSDADVAVDLEPKEQDAGKHRALMEKRATEAAAGGKRFSGVRERTAWGLTEMWRYLQGDSKLLHLVPPEDKVLAQTETRVVYEED
jgi:predicted nucleotidyltransferase